MTFNPDQTIKLENNTPEIRTEDLKNTQELNELDLKILKIRDEIVHLKNEVIPKLESLFNKGGEQEEQTRRENGIKFAQARVKELEKEKQNLLDSKYFVDKQEEKIMSLEEATAQDVEDKKTREGEIRAKYAEKI